MNKSIEAVQRQLAYRPFRPFWLVTVAGMRIRVQRPEWFYEVPDGPIYISDTRGVTITWWSDLSETVEIEGPTE